MFLWQLTITRMDPNGGKLDEMKLKPTDFQVSQTNDIKHSALKELHSSSSSRDKIGSAVGGRSNSQMFDRKIKGGKHNNTSALLKLSEK